MFSYFVSAQRAESRAIENLSVTLISSTTPEDLFTSRGSSFLMWILFCTWHSESALELHYKEPGNLGTSEEFHTLGQKDPLTSAGVDLVL